MPINRNVYREPLLSELLYGCTNSIKIKSKKYIVLKGYTLGKDLFSRSGICINKKMFNKAHVSDDLNSITNNGKCDSEPICNNDDIDYYLKIKNMKNGGKTMNSLSNLAINYAKERIIEFAIGGIKNKFGIEYNFKFSSDQYLDFLKWLKKYDNNFKNHIVKNNKSVAFKYLLKDMDMLIRIDNNTFCRITTGKHIMDKLSDVEKFNHCVFAGEVKIYAFGKNCYKVMKDLLSIEEPKELSCYKVSSSSSSYRNNKESLCIFLEMLNKRNSDTVFLCDDIENKLFNHIDKFMHNKSIYEKRNLNYKTGILLYGLPGTGKTSIANMICTKYNMDMILINMSEFASINIEELTSSINADSEEYIILMEDIDCVIGDRDSKEDNDDDKKNVNKLLQFLDSTSSPSNVIFIATTNHIEKLDKAILRDGRFDLILNIDDIDRPTAIKMCKSFNLSDNDTEKILSINMEDGKINPSKLQNLILQKIENHIN